MNKMIDNGSLKGKGLVGFWPAQSEGDDINVYEADVTAPRQTEPIAKFYGLRQQVSPRQLLGVLLFLFFLRDFIVSPSKWESTGTSSAVSYMTNSWFQRPSSVYQLVSYREVDETFLFLWFQDTGLLDLGQVASQTKTTSRNGIPVWPRFSSKVLNYFNSMHQ